MDDNNGNKVVGAALDGLAILIFLVLVSVFWWVIFWIVKLIFRNSGFVLRFLVVCFVTFLVYINCPEDCAEMWAIISFGSGIVSMFFLALNDY